VSLVVSVGLSLPDRASLVLPDFWIAWGLTLDVAPYLLGTIAIVAMLIWRAWNFNARVDGPEGGGRVSARGQAVLFAVWVVAGSAVSGWYGVDLADLPPLYHDEYSYLFQAKSFLAGRASWPSPAMHLHFDQVHVLNDDGVVASRYFPGTAAWLAPFVAWGRAVAGCWLAHGLIAGFVAMSASRWSWSAGWIAGALSSVSPALVVFSNLLLSPVVAMVGLSAGWWAFQESIVTRSRVHAVFAGLAIGFAFLTRPLTAAAVAGPWAVFVVAYAWRDPSRRAILLAMAVAFAPSVGGLAIFNRAVTGSVWVTPYGLYTQRYTPSHVFGFYNRTRGERQRTERTLDAYDRWVVELTPRRSIAVMISRWRASANWTAGLVPVLALGLAALLRLPWQGDRALLPTLSILSLTAAHIPFFYEGILGFSYIAEAVPFVLILMGGTLASAQTSLMGRRWAGSIVGGGFVTAIAYVSLSSTLPSSRDPGSELVYPRIQAARRLARERAMVGSTPALILYDVDRTADLHTSWVYNDPPLTGSILRAWALDRADDLMKAFPDRSVYLFKDGVYRRLR
jgi:hypothetical protein